MDLFGRAARAEANLLRKLLDEEKARTKELTDRLILMADAKAFGMIHPREKAQKPENLFLDPNPVVTKPGFKPGIDGVMEKAIASLEKKN